MLAIVAVAESHTEVLYLVDDDVVVEMVEGIVVAVVDGSGASH